MHDCQVIFPHNSIGSLIQESSHEIMPKYLFDHRNKCIMCRRTASNL